MTTDLLETPVMIVGGGPVGLALAADLASRDVASILVETRTEPTVHPRATLLGSRSMEYYRRLGIHEQIVDAGLPTDHGYTVLFATRLAGKLLYKHGSPSPDDYRAAHREMRTDLPESAWTPFYKVQIGQHALEPVVKAWVEKAGKTDVRYGWEFLGFVEDGDQVISTIRDVESGETRKVRSRFLVGCDGGRSQVRRQLAIPYVGRGAMRRNISYLFHSPAFSQAATVGNANLYFMFTPGTYGVFTNVGRDMWNYQHYVFDDREDAETIDAAAEIRAAMGHDFAFEIQQVLHWSHHQSVADIFRVGNVFLAGDSAHLFCPTGGIGMNTGIADSFNLGWKLSAILAGWGGEGLLESYEWERRPVAFRNTIAAANNADRIDAMMRVTPVEIEDDGEAGDAARERFGKRLSWLSKQFNSAGLHLGMRYAESPIIVGDRSPEPPDDPRIVVQSTWPGCRAPHIWLEPDKSTLDLVDGSGFVLVQTGDADGVETFEAAARAAGIPFKVVPLHDPRVAELYERRLVLVRPDGHVCWRGDAVPVDPTAILAIASGNGSLGSIVHDRS